MKGYISALLFGAALAAPAVPEKRSVVIVEEVVTKWSTVTVYKHKATGKAGFFEFPSGFSISASATSTASSSSTSSTSSSAPPTSSAPSLSIPSLAVASPPSSIALPAIPSAPALAPAPAPAAPAPASGGPSGTGDITFYSLGLVSCGQTYSDTDDVVALATSVMNNGANSNNNPLCGKTITITYGGVTATAKVVDTCEGCAPGNIDLSPTLFQKFAPLTAGRVPGVTWSVAA